VRGVFPFKRKVQVGTYKTEPGPECCHRAACLQQHPIARTLLGFATPTRQLALPFYRCWNRACFPAASLITIFIVRVYVCACVCLSECGLCSLACVFLKKLFVGRTVSRNIKNAAFPNAIDLQERSGFSAGAAIPSPAPYVSPPSNVGLRCRAGRVFVYLRRRRESGSSNNLRQ